MAWFFRRTLAPSVCAYDSWANFCLRICLSRAFSLLINKHFDREKANPTTHNGCDWNSGLLYRLWQPFAYDKRNPTKCPALRVLRRRKSRFVDCRRCLTACLILCIDTGSKVTIAQTKPSDFPSFLRQKLQSSVQAVEKHNVQTESTAFETCPKCGREEVKYTTVQLRGADEGSTVIYNCECGNS